MLGGSAGSSLGIFISVIASTVDVAVALINPILIPFLLSMGLLFNNDTIPDWFFFKYFNPMSYMYSGVLHAMFDGLPDMSSDLRSEAISEMHLPTNYWDSIYAIVGILIGFRLIAALLLVLTSRKL